MNKSWVKDMNPTKTGGELICSRRVSTSCFTSGTCHVTVMSHEREKEMKGGQGCDHNKWNKGFTLNMICSPEFDIKDAPMFLKL